MNRSTKAKEISLSVVITHLPKFKTDLELAKYVRDFLLRQGERSLLLNGDGCAYRGENGTACAAGCLILDIHYARRIENTSSLSDVVHSAIYNSIGNYNSNLVFELQQIHDGHFPDEWENEFDQLFDSFDDDGNYIPENKPGSHVSI